MTDLSQAAPSNLETNGSAGGDDRTGYFEHERLDVYRVALDFVRLTEELVRSAGTRQLRDQLVRASDSVVANIGEGAGKTSGAAKRASYEIARGSAMECAALLDLFRIRDQINDSKHAAARALLFRVVQMLSRMTATPR